VDGNRRYDTRKKETRYTNSNRKCAPQRLPRDEITVTNREAGNEGEIDRIPERPALNKTSQQAHGKLNSENYRAIIALFRVINRYVGNLPPMPGVFPDYPAPVVRNSRIS
jgi:hypothetical protein